MTKSDGITRKKKSDKQSQTFGKYGKNTKRGLRILETLIEKQSNDTAKTLEV